MGPSKNRKQTMPSTRMAPATKKFAANEPVLSKMKPAAIGAIIPARLLKKFICTISATICTL